MLAGSSVEVVLLHHQDSLQVSLLNRDSLEDSMNVCSKDIYEVPLRHPHMMADRAVGWKLLELEKNI